MRMWYPHNILLSSTFGRVSGRMRGATHVVLVSAQTMASALLTYLSMYFRNRHSVTGPSQINYERLNVLESS